MESCLQSAERLFYSWTELKSNIISFWSTADFVKLFLEIEEREIGLVECPPSSKDVAVQIQKGQFYWPYVSEIVGKTKKHSEVLSRCEE